MQTTCKTDVDIFVWCPLHRRRQQISSCRKTIACIVLTRVRYRLPDCDHAGSRTHQTGWYLNVNNVTTTALSDIIGVRSHMDKALNFSLLFFVFFWFPISLRSVGAVSAKYAKYSELDGFVRLGTCVGDLFRPHLFYCSSTLTQKSKGREAFTVPSHSAVRSVLTISSDT